jgi:hypothetical protein
MALIVTPEIRAEEGGGKRSAPPSRALTLLLIKQLFF